ncbi:hypothetical protein [Burkholderia ubonensis]|uniref:hypothetical protein n=1 Tax=Burkholderia ubonensis TaxID=101571 RepID=UPI000F57F990|nr:hypothetical protein [Burkholderia ubonensis]
MADLDFLCFDDDKRHMDGMKEINRERLDQFCDAWLQKAHDSDIHAIAGVFDRFFALWIVFNRLYEEAAHILVRENHSIARRFPLRGQRLYRPPPDRLSATRGVVYFCGSVTLRQALKDDRHYEDIEDALRCIERGEFHLHENYETGEPDREEDMRLVQRSRQGDPEALLTLLYQARCNLFHGQKAYSESQRPLLNGMIVILAVAIDRTRQAMRQRR